MAGVKSCICSELMQRTPFNSISFQVSRAMTKTEASRPIRYFDIGFNISDAMFQGHYHGRKHHDSDIPNILARCRATNVEKLLITGSSIHESKHSIKLCSQYLNEEAEGPKMMYTIGVHPCQVNEFVPHHGKSVWTKDHVEDPAFDIVDHHFTEQKLHELFDLFHTQQLKDSEHFRAIGEIGMDFDRLHYAGIKIQKFFFVEQLKLSCFFPEVPLFLHMRSCTDEFAEILQQFIKGFKDEQDTFNFKKFIDPTVEGSPEWNKEDASIFYKFSETRKFVVHSFTGSKDDMERLLHCSKNCYFSLNGVSMREESGIPMVAALPIDKLLLETDAPWCEMKRTHPSFKYLNDSNDAKITDAWNHGLSNAYPKLDQWFKSVKKEKLSAIPREKWDEYMVKSRNEPCAIGHVATAVANIKGIPLIEIVDKAWHNSIEVYGE